MATQQELIAEAQRRGLMTDQPSRDSMMAEAQKRGLITSQQQPQEQPQEQPQQENLSYFDRMKQRNAGAIQAGENLTEKIKASIKGNAEFPDAGSFESWQWSQPNLGFNMANIKTTAAGMFGSDKDKFASFVKQNPNVKIFMDNAQNPYFEDKGKKYYLDMPGLDAGDIGDFMGEAGLFAAGGNVAQIGNKANALRRATQMGVSQGATDVLAQNLAGKEDINYGQSVMTGVAGGGFDLVGSGINKMRNARAGANELTGNKKLAVDYANKRNLNIGYDDVAENALARGAGQQIDNMPFIGGGRDRQIQNLAQRAEAERVTKSFALPDTEMDDLYSITSQGMKNQFKKSKDIASQKFEAVNKKLNNELGNFDVPNLKRKAEQIIQEQIKQGSAADQDVIKAMQKYIDIPEGDFSHWSKIRSKIVGQAAEADKVMSQTSGEVTGALKRLSNTMNSSMDDVANKSSGALKKEWRDANKFYKTEVGKFKKGELRKLVNDEDPEKILQILTRKGGADTTTSKFRANRIYNSLDEKGKLAAKGAMMQKAFKESISEVDDFSPAKYATMLENYSKRLGIMLSKEDKQTIDGLTAYMRLTQAAGNFGRNTPTGHQAVPALYGLTAGAGLTANPAGTIAAGAGIYSLRKLFRTKRGRSFMLAMSKYPKGKKPPPELLTQLTRFLAVDQNRE